MFKKLTLLLIVCFPVAAFAEGAVRELSCAYSKLCDGKGACQDESGDMMFMMEPVTVTEDGSGSFTIHYGGREADMQAAGFAGPFTWTTPLAVNTLMASSEQEFLWHQLVLDKEPYAKIHFMHCRFTQ